MVELRQDLPLAPQAAGALATSWRKLSSSRPARKTSPMPPLPSTRISR
jgi:hypothetical protein